MAKPVFDTTARAAEKVPEAVVVKDRRFVVDRSGDAMEKVMTLDTGDDDASDEAKASLAVGLVYESLSYLLRDGEGGNPNPDWLKSNIDFEVASELVNELMPQGEGDVPPVPVPEIPSIPGSGESL